MIYFNSEDWSLVNINNIITNVIPLIQSVFKSQRDVFCVFIIITIFQCLNVSFSHYACGVTDLSFFCKAGRLLKRNGFYTFFLFLNALNVIRISFRSRIFRFVFTCVENSCVEDIYTMFALQTL